MRNQHGDVILEKVNSIPEGAKKVKLFKGYIVEKGEGVHTHTIATEEGVEGYVLDGVLFLHVTAPEVPLLDHEEHSVQVYKEGIYRKGIELEYDAETDEARKTQD